MNREDNNTISNNQNSEGESKESPLTRILYFVDSDISKNDKTKKEKEPTILLTDQQAYNIIFNTEDIFEDRISVETLKYIHLNKRLPPCQNKIRVKSTSGVKANLFRLIILLDIKVSECNRIFRVELKNGQKPADNSFYNEFVHNLSRSFPDFDFSIYPKAPKPIN